MLFSVDTWTKLDKNIICSVLPSNNRDKLYAQLLLYKVFALKFGQFSNKFQSMDVILILFRVLTGWINLSRKFMSLYFNNETII